MAGNRLKPRILGAGFEVLRLFGAADCKHGAAADAQNGVRRVTLVKDAVAAVCGPVDQRGTALNQAGVVAVDGVAGGVNVYAASADDHIALCFGVARGVQAVVAGSNAEFAAADQHMAAFQALVALCNGDAAAVNADAEVAFDSVVFSLHREAGTRNAQRLTAVDAVLPGLDAQASATVDGQIVDRGDGSPFLCFGGEAVFTRALEDHLFRSQHLDTGR